MSVWLFSRWQRVRFRRPPSPLRWTVRRLRSLSLSWKLVLPNLLSDQENIWGFPSRLGHERDWVPAAAVLGAGAGLAALDPTEARYFRGTNTFSGFNRVFSSNATMTGILLAPAALYVASLSRKDTKMRGTALFAAEALADAAVVSTVLKNVTRRVRPGNFPANGNLSDSWFESGGSVFGGRAGFPSGHAISAFSVATVVARRYGSHRWIPYAAYGAAALVGFSRLTLSAHFVSDVFIGAALGYSISRFSVLRE